MQPKREFYSFSEDDEPDSIDCVANYGATVEDAEASIAEDRERAEKDNEEPEYFDTLRLYRITIEEIKREPKR